MTPARLAEIRQRAKDDGPSSWSADVLELLAALDELEILAELDEVERLKRHIDVLTSRSGPLPPLSLEDIVTLGGPNA